MSYLDQLREAVLAQGGEWTTRRASEAMAALTLSQWIPTPERARIMLNKLADEGLLVKHGVRGRLWTPAPAPPAAVRPAVDAAAFVPPLDVVDHAERAAALAVRAERIQDRYPEEAAHLDWHASRSRRKALARVAASIRAQHAGLSEDVVDYHARRLTGEVMRDAYRAERGKQAVARG